MESVVKRIREEMEENRTGMLGTRTVLRVSDVETLLGELERAQAPLLALEGEECGCCGNVFSDKDCEEECASLHYAVEQALKRARAK